jgi:IS30 family transposase
MVARGGTRAIAAELAQLAPALRRSLTWDRGREMAEHQQLAAQLGIDVYFCDPRSPWQRGSNENANRLLRQYLAKGADLQRFSLRDLDDIAERTNTRPRPCARLGHRRRTVLAPCPRGVHRKPDRSLSRDGGTAGGLTGQGPSVAAVVRPLR